MSTIVATNIQSDTIKHSGGTTAMTIDSTGRILQPAKPSFFAHMTGGTWVSNVADDAVLPFNTTLHNTGTVSYTHLTMPTIYSV